MSWVWTLKEELIVFPSCWGIWWLRKNSVTLIGLVWCGIGKCLVLPACRKSFLLRTDSVSSLLIETCRHLNTCFCSASNYSIYFLRVTRHHPGHQLPHLVRVVVFLLASYGYKARRSFLFSRGESFCSPSACLRCEMWLHRHFLFTCSSVSMLDGDDECFLWEVAGSLWAG